MKTIVVSFLTAAVLSGAALATRGDAQTGPMMATLVCRPAQSTDVAAATTASGTALICKSLDMRRIMALKPMVMAAPKGQPAWIKALESFDFESHQ